MVMDSIFAFFLLVNMDERFMILKGYVKLDQGFNLINPD